MTDSPGYREEWVMELMPMACIFAVKDESSSQELGWGWVWGIESTKGK